LWVWKRLFFHESGAIQNVKLILKAFPKSFGRWETDKNTLFVQGVWTFDKNSLARIDVVAIFNVF
jgi:hypothetical protein